MLLAVRLYVICVSCSFKFIYEYLWKRFIEYKGKKRFVWRIRLTHGFWFQVDSDPCRQGDSGARGKKPLPFHSAPPTFCHHPQSKHQSHSVVVVWDTEMLSVRSTSYFDGVNVYTCFWRTWFAALELQFHWDIFVLSRCMAWHRDAKRNVVVYLVILFPHTLIWFSLGPVSQTLFKDPSCGHVYSLNKVFQKCIYWQKDRVFTQMIPITIS